MDVCDADNLPRSKRPRHTAEMATPECSSLPMGCLPVEMLHECMQHMDMPTLVAFSATDRTRRALYISMFRSPAFVSRLNRYIETCGVDALTRFGTGFQRAYASHMGGGRYLSDQHVVAHVHVTAAPSDNFPQLIVSVGRFECDLPRAIYKGAFVVYAHDGAASPPTVTVDMDIVLDVDANCRHRVDVATRRQQKWKEDNAEYIGRHTTYREHPEEMRIYLQPRVHYRYEGDARKRLNSGKQWEKFGETDRQAPSSALARLFHLCKPPSRIYAHQHPLSGQRPGRRPLHAPQPTLHETWPARGASVRLDDDMIAPPPLAQLSFVPRSRACQSSDDNNNKEHKFDVAPRACGSVDRQL
ncbi:hypothetical protein psal_cds_776 [Pandoravirus salinus]|uniref:F-box domain containing protein n=1 Tax=Pandoravirus salinus TaxID=1349410 RepID=S4VWM8_9VIRU|nr:hypothetical protein psal_cds_776 [Pandoravirus salinus]AGO84778.1 hypothetical protein psal_cds_776 [Pandoravirus salinus]